MSSASDGGTSDAGTLDGRTPESGTLETAAPVVISGLGWVGAAGCGRQALADTLSSGQVVTSTVDGLDSYGRQDGGPPRSVAHPGARLAHLAAHQDLSSWLHPRKARRMSPPSKFAVAAAHMACADASLEVAAAGDAMAVVLATNFGPSSFTEGILEQIYTESPEAVSPFFFTESVANAPAAQVALALGATGPNITVTQREVGCLMALGRAAREIENGRAEVALVLAVDEMTALLHRVLNRFGALARDRGEGEVARPFDGRRNGAMASEGACALVLESAEHCRRRGGLPLARLRAQVAAFDPSAPSAGWGSRSEDLASQLRQGLLRQGVPIDSIDRVVSGACGHRQGDLAEAHVLRNLWGETPLPPVVVPKATVGEYAGGFLASAVLAATGVPFAATPGFRQLDADLGVEPYDGGPLASPRRLLISTLAVGGSAAWLVLEP